MKIKNNKGVTLIALAVAVTVILIITDITIYNFSWQLGIKNVNNLYSDIETLKEKASAYYLGNNEIPYFENNSYAKYTKEQFKSQTGIPVEALNKNDGDEYYIINLSKLNNLTLNYGREYKTWQTTATAIHLGKTNDVYIINGKTHQIYYAKGVKYKGMRYFTKNSDANTINNIEAQEGLNSYNIEINNEQITNVESNLYALATSIEQNNTRVNLKIKITETTGNVTTNKLKYCFQGTNSEDTPIFTEFELNSENKTTLISKELSAGNYYVIIKIFDDNGNVYDYKIEGITITN